MHVRIGSMATTSQPLTSVAPSRTQRTRCTPKHICRAQLSLFDAPLLCFLLVEIVGTIDGGCRCSHMSTVKVRQKIDYEIVRVRERGHACIMFSMCRLENVVKYKLTAMAEHFPMWMCS